MRLSNPAGINLAAYLLALGLALAGAAAWSPRPAALHAAPPPADGAIRAEALAGGGWCLRDADGTPVPLRPWARIVTLDVVSDELAALLIERERLVAVSRWAQGPEAWRLEGLPRVAGLDDLQALVALRPDLAIVASFGGELERLARLREAGIAVFNLGPARGLADLLAAARRVGILVGAPERGERLASALARRMAAVAADVPPERRRRALLLTPLADQVYGGTAGSSYHDVLVAAGLLDAAAGHFAEPWPRLSAEQVLALDPELIVTRTGGAALLRRLPGFARLAVVQRPDGIVELPTELFDSPGPSMLEAAEALRALAYPRERP